MYHHYLPTSPKGPKVANLSLSRPSRPLVARPPTAKRAAFVPSSRHMTGSRNHSASACGAAAATPIVARPLPKGSDRRSASPSASAAGALVHKTRYAWLSLAVRCAATRHQWQRVYIPVARTARRGAGLASLSLLYLAFARALRQQDAAEVRHLLGRDFGGETDRAAAERRARRGAEALAKSLGQDAAATAPPASGMDEAEEGRQPIQQPPGGARRAQTSCVNVAEDSEARRRDATADATTAHPAPRTKRCLRFSNALPLDEDGEERPPNPSGEPRAQWVIANQGARARAHFANLQAAAPAGPEATGEGTDDKTGRRPGPLRRESEWEDEAEREEDVFQVEFGF